MVTIPSELPLPLLQVTAPALRRALVAGMRRVIAERETLNRINVFPVPDGDTGSNLAFTFGSVLEGSLSRRSRSAGELLRQVADDAIDGARGNSGAIFAQFLQGLSEAAGSARVLTSDSLAQAAMAGSASAREALSEPVEGTILSVIRAFAEALQAQVGAGVRDLRAGFAAALARARVALADTPRQLAALRHAGVVDAGAQGFVDLLEGISDFIEHGARGVSGGSDVVREFAGAHALGDAEPTRRWCSECLVAGSDLDREALRDSVSQLLADSVVVAGGRQRVRVHAHVDDPGALFEAVARFGIVSGCKADDMLAQHRAASSTQPVAIVTDSGADLPQSEREQLGINIVPVRVNFGELDFLDKVSITPAEFYARLRGDGELPQTSQPPPGDFRRQFEFLLSHHAELLYVGLSRALSGTLQAGESAAARVDAGRAGVVDTGHASCGQGLIAIMAARAARAGADSASIRALVEGLRPRTYTFAVAPDISFAVRGGRVPAWSRPLVEAFGVTPVARMRDDGRLKLAGALWGRRDVPRRFADYIRRHVPRGGTWRLLVGHGDCEADGERLLDALRERFDGTEGWLVETGPAIGAHAGPRALVAGLQRIDVAFESNFKSQSPDQPSAVTVSPELQARTI